MSALTGRCGCCPRAHLRSSENDSAESRFLGKEPIKAIRILLAESGGRMNRNRLMEALIAGGATSGKKRGVSNLRISIDLNLQNGNLLGEGDEILLPPDRLKGPN